MRTTVFVSLLLSLPVSAADLAAYTRTAASVVRVVARLPNSNSTSFGSGVVLPDGRVATNCHVIRGDQRVVVLEGGAAIELERVEGDLAADLCTLRGNALAAPPAILGPARALKIGDEVVAIGFGGGAGRSISSGRVTALYPYHNGRVIQTTAAFRQGASGGGLFDAQGNLVGITTFFRRKGTESAFFAIPVEWLDGLGNATSAQPNPDPFWMRAQGDQPLFLRVAAYEADGRWAEMEAAARLWTQEEPEQAQPWEALSHALMELGEVTEGGAARLRARNMSGSAHPSTQ